jgi:hypothetical protein
MIFAVREHALDVEIVDRKVSRAADPCYADAICRLEGDAIDLDVADVVGEAEHHAIPAGDLQR